MLGSLLFGALMGALFFALLLYTPWSALLGTVLFLIYEVCYNSTFFNSLFCASWVFLLLFISSRVLYHPFGKPVTIWSSLFMRDDEWITVLNISLYQSVVSALRQIFSDFSFSSTKNTNINTNSDDDGNDRESTKTVAVGQHLHCVMCYVTHLPTKRRLSGVLSNILSNYPQLRNIPIVGDTITQSSFETDYSLYSNVDGHIHEYELSKPQMHDLADIFATRIPMDQSIPWWDIFLITPTVENDIRALDPQHAMLCVVLFRFHQSIIDQPTIKQFLMNVSAEFQKLNGYFEDVDDDDMEEESKIAMLSNVTEYPSQFGLLRDASSSSITPASRSVHDLQQLSEENIVNEMSAGDHGNRSWMDFTHHMQWLQHQCKMWKKSAHALLVVCSMWFKNGNVFDSNNGRSSVQVVSERFEDTALKKIEREAKSTIEHICRTCIAGAIHRYFQDLVVRNNNGQNDRNSAKNNDLMPLFRNARILESFDLSQNQTELMSALSEKSDEFSTEIPLFRESIGWTSIDLGIADVESQTSRSRLMSVTHHRHDIAMHSRIAFWMNNCFKMLCLLLPDLVSKKLISLLMQNHSMEVCYFEYEENFILGAEPVEELRVLKTNLNIPCLCISAYNEHISLDLTFTNVAVKNPSGLIQGFLAELEQLEAMFR